MPKPTASAAVCKALAYYPQGRLVICCEEKTGMQVLERKAPTKPAQPGRRERREHEYIRHGTRVLINSLAVATGQIAWTIGRTRTATDFVAHLQQAYQRLPRMTRYEWVLDNLNTHWSLDVCRLVARWCKVPFEPQKLKKGPQRRAFLSDPSHRHVFHFTQPSVAVSPFSGNFVDFFDSFSVRFLRGQGPQNATHGDRDSSPDDLPNARAGDPMGPSPAARRPPRWLSTATRPTRPN